VNSWLIRRWRQSLEVRIVATTLIASAIVVALLGLVVLSQVKHGLLDAKTRVALAETTSGVRTAQQSFDALDRNDAPAQNDLLNSLTQPRSGGALFNVVVLPSTGAEGPNTTGYASCEIGCEADVPSALRSFVSTTGEEGYAYTRIHHENARSEPGLAVGALLNAGSSGSYEVYYLFPLQQEADTLSLVRSTLAFAGLALVLLLAGIAALVTRQVVVPVRAAARTAQSLTAGRLEERMKVRGEDDLARLATSFNVMADSLQRQIVQLEELSRVQRQFVSDVSHELRTPLTTVRMAADVLHESRGSFEPAVSRSAELLQAQLDRFEALLADLLEISRHDAGAVVLEAEPTDVRTLVDRVVSSCEPLALRRGSDVHMDLPQRPVTAEVDSRRIERILRNLLVNAVEHGEGNDIVVRVRADDDAVAVVIRDHGVGLQPGQAAAVFSRFWRADPARARTTGGTGLGLSIALEDARLHGGWLQAWGEPGMGAQFRLTVPRRAGEHLHSSPLALQPDDVDDLTHAHVQGIDDASIDERTAGSADGATPSVPTPGPTSVPEGAGPHA
jgi:two-component system sensor histidine kinase MtrB